VKKSRYQENRAERTAPYQIESVERACRIMRILQNEGSLALYELAEIAHLSRPTVFRLVATLQANGMVVKDGSRNIGSLAVSRLGNDTRSGISRKQEKPPSTAPSRGDLSRVQSGLVWTWWS
jgi:hypothetical protein